MENFINSVSNTTNVSSALDKIDKAPSQPAQKSNAGMNFEWKPIGVVEPPKLSKTPIQDRLERAKDENARVTLNIEKPKPKATASVFKVLNYAIFAIVSVFSVDFLIKILRKKP